jgi:hypothetical protein
MESARGVETYLFDLDCRPHLDTVNIHVVGLGLLSTSSHHGQ